MIKNKKTGANIGLIVGIVAVLFSMIMILAVSYSTGYSRGDTAGKDSCRVTINKELRDMSDQVDQVLSDHAYNLAWDCNGTDIQTLNTRSEVEDMIDKECTISAIW